MKFAILSICAILLICTTCPLHSTYLAQNCQNAQDCYVIPRVLGLACYYNVNKCNCQTTISSIHRVESVNGQCLMSKYGPCGSNGPNLTVGCLDGFECLGGQCVDPSSPQSSLKSETPYVFENSSCERGCNFGANDEIRFRCGSFSIRSNKSPEKCVCNPLHAADAPRPIWDIRNFDGNHKCSVGKYGPCGSLNGIEVECHGSGIECVNGRCINPTKPVSGLNEDCEIATDCEQGLICSGSHVCIKPNSLGRGSRCKSQEECVEGLKCKRSGSPWTLPSCS